MAHVPLEVEVPVGAREQVQDNEDAFGERRASFAASMNSFKDFGITRSDSQQCAANLLSRWAAAHRSSSSAGIASSSTSTGTSPSKARSFSSSSSVAVGRSSKGDDSSPGIDSALSKEPRRADLVNARPTTSRLIDIKMWTLWVDPIGSLLYMG